MSKFKTFVSLLVIIFIGAFFRFYKLDWGQGLFTHPDEYHIVASVSQLSFPNQMHPHFFSYGTVTIYLIYFTNQFFQAFNLFLLGRFYSAFFSMFVILLAYKTTCLFLKKHWGLLAAFLVAISPGLIQQAHFATPESSLTFFLFGALFFILKFTKTTRTIFLILASAFFGLSLGIKISALTFAPVLLCGIIIKSWHSKTKLLKLIVINCLITISVFFVVAPYVFLDFPAFRSNLEYEGGLAVGKIEVFYTRQFIGTIPVLFQIEKILPYALGPALLLTGVLGFFAYLFSLFKKLKPGLLLLLIAFLSLFLPNAFLFAKWTRFIAPTFPFFAIFTAFFLSEIEQKNKTLTYVLAGIVVLTTFIWTYAFFSIYRNPDVRITASSWLEKNAPPSSTILVEGGNMIDIPLRGDFQRISLDFYNLENNLEDRQKVINTLEQADYFIIQSRRVFLNHQRLKDQFPKTARFYDKLFAGDLGFAQIKEFHSYPQLEVGSLKLEVPDEAAEETWSVFDHPVIRVFKKERLFPKETYERIFNG